jgi:sugar phosphate isomerase/epimerase
MDRRRFLDTTIKSVVGGTLLSTPVFGKELKLPGMHLFSKVLQFLDYSQMAEAAAAAGLAGVDLTVRPGGHVDPDNFERDLPLAISAIKAAGLRCAMITTGITSTENRRNFALLSLARSLGVETYRTGSLRYDKETHPMEAIDQYRRQLTDLAAWNREIGITGIYQNHSGERRLGAAIWDLYLVLRDLDPDYLGCQFDIRHAVVEGGLEWPDSYQLMKPFIRSICLKDFRWGEVDGRWRVVNTPVGQGMVDFRRYLGMLQNDKIDVPVSLHLEYDLGGAEKGRREPAITTSEVQDAIRKDIAALNSLWKEA